MFVFAIVAKETFWVRQFLYLDKFFQAVWKEKKRTDKIMKLKIVSTWLHKGGQKEAWSNTVYSKAVWFWCWLISSARGIFCWTPSPLLCLIGACCCLSFSLAQERGGDVDGKVQEGVVFLGRSPARQTCYLKKMTLDINLKATIFISNDVC